MVLGPATRGPADTAGAPDFGASGGSNPERLAVGVSSGA